MRLAVEIDTGKIDSLCRLRDCHSPGVAVGIALHGRPIYRRAYGLAHLELPTLLSPAMRMRIGSTSKHFTSLAYLLLCEDGRAALDDRVGKYLPELHATARSVSARQLMAHVSGLADAHEIAWQSNGSAAISSQELLDLYRAIDAPNSAPGGFWSYNNGGYLILSAIIERITGQALEEVLQDRVFRPVGMFDTMLRRNDDDFVPNSATLHTIGPHGKFGKHYLGTALAGEGGIVSTIDDMLAWLAHMDQPRVGASGTWAALKAPYQLANGTSTGYGLGLIINEYRGQETISHGGGVLGGNSQMLKLPAVGLDVVVMMNRDDMSAARLANEIVDACIPSMAPRPKSVEWSCVDGVFRSPTTGRVIQLFARDGQQFVSIDGYDWPFVAEGHDVLRPDAIWSHFKWRVCLVGNHQWPTSLRFEDFGNVDELVRLEKSEETEVPAGTYFSASTGTEVRIHVEGERRYMTARGRLGLHTYTLEPLSADLWRARSHSTIPWDAVLFFPPGRRELYLNALRTKRLRFVRH